MGVDHILFALVGSLFVLRSELSMRLQLFCKKFGFVRVKLLLGKSALSATYWISTTVASSEASFFHRTLASSGGLKMEPFRCIGSSLKNTSEYLPPLNGLAS